MKTKAPFTPDKGDPEYLCETQQGSLLLVWVGRLFESNGYSQLFTCNPSYRDNLQIIVYGGRLSLNGHIVP